MTDIINNFVPSNSSNDFNNSNNSNDFNNSNNSNISTISSINSTISSYDKEFINLTDNELLQFFKNL